MGLFHTKILLQKYSYKYTTKHEKCRLLEKKILYTGNSKENKGRWDYFVFNKIQKSLGTLKSSLKMSGSYTHIQSNSILLETWISHSIMEISCTIVMPSYSSS